MEREELRRFILEAIVPQVSKLAPALQSGAKTVQKFMGVSPIKKDAFKAAREAAAQKAIKMSKSAWGTMPSKVTTSVQAVGPR